MYFVTPTCQTDFFGRENEASALYKLLLRKKFSLYQEYFEKGPLDAQTLSPFDSNE